MIHAHWDLEKSKSIKGSKNTSLNITHVRSEFLVFVDPVVENTEWADDEERPGVVIFPEVGTEGDRL